jgi:magnesium chelatase subunit I
MAATKDPSTIKTFGELKKSGNVSLTIKDELRSNLISKLQNKEKAFEGILGYEDSVIPDIERAILSRHNINLLGLRGQAKTRIARLMIGLLDEYVPVVAGSELNDDPFRPVSRFAIDLLAELGEKTPISWLHRSERYAEKLATPDVSVADLIGDVDPIKAATMKLNYSDERVIHFGLIPRSNRCIFVINELPDLQARIQVSLFNILQEGDIQIRGFRMRMPLDIQFIFTANPEDYTNRGSIVTPLKDRIGSQILTHYPKDLAVAKEITLQEVAVHPEQKAKVHLDDVAHNILEQVGFEARKSEYVDAKSGVSARLSISAYQNLVSAAERRALINGEKETYVRISDFNGIVAAITGKIELVYEGEQEGTSIVAQNLIGKAIRSIFPVYFPAPDKIKKQNPENPYKFITDWFANGNTIDLLNEQTDKEFATILNKVEGLKKCVEKYQPAAKDNNQLLMMEFVLHGLSEYSKLSKNSLQSGLRFKDLFSSVFNVNGMDGENSEEM